MNSYPLIPGSKTSGTSADAAAAMKPKATKLRSLCMAVLAAGPQTADEVAAKLRLNVLSVRPRFSELRALGLIKPVGLRRPSSTGASSSVWRAVAARGGIQPTNFMGLDICAYQNLKPLDCKFNADHEPLDDSGQPLDWGNYTHLTANSHYVERMAGRAEGYYTFEKSHSFRAGSYSGYNDWRETLAKMAGYPTAPSGRSYREGNRHDEGAWKADSGPFWELISFSDCEGCIGPVVSAKLAKDFADFQSKADEQDEYFRDRYAMWRAAFEMAAQDGAVDFH